MAAATWDARIDLENDGDFTGAGETVTGKVRPPEGAARLIEVKRGNDPQGQLHLPRAGALAMELSNDDQAYAPGGTLKLGRAARIQATFSAVTYDVFRGTLERPEYLPPVTFRRQVRTPAVGPFASLVGKSVSTALYANVAVGTAIGHLLDAAGFSGAMRDLDVGQAILDWWWLDDEDAYKALIDLLITEGAGARLFERGDGFIVFKDRHAHLVETASTTVQTTFRSAAGGAEPLLSHPFSYSDGIQDVVNDVRREVVTRALGTVDAVVWTGPATISLGNAQVLAFRARASGGDPFTAAIAPVAGVDYTLVSGSLSSVTLDRTSGGNVTITLTAGAAGALVTGLQLRATQVPVTVRGLVQNTYSTATSQAEFGTRAYPYTARREVTVGEAAAWCNEVAIMLENGIPYAAVPLAAFAADARMTAALARQIGDRIRIIETDHSIDRECHVDAVAHALNAPNALTTTIYARQAVAAAADAFVLDVSTLDGGDKLWA